MSSMRSALVKDASKLNFLLGESQKPIFLGWKNSTRDVQMHLVYDTRAGTEGSFGTHCLKGRTPRRRHTYGDSAGQTRVYQRRAALLGMAGSEYLVCPRARDHAWGFNGVAWPRWRMASLSSPSNSGSRHPRPFRHFFVQCVCRGSPARASQSEARSVSPGKGPPPWLLRRPAPRRAILRVRRSAHLSSCSVTWLPLAHPREPLSRPPVQKSHSNISSTHPSTSGSQSSRPSPSRSAGRPSRALVPPRIPSGTSSGQLDWEQSRQGIGLDRGNICYRRRGAAISRQAFLALANRKPVGSRPEAGGQFPDQSKLLLPRLSPLVRFRLVPSPLEARLVLRLTPAAHVSPCSTLAVSLVYP